ncbi:MAG: hypothetical protein Q4G11_05250 [Gallicola sp.]|nr:hypothetical protein [Gallicola sp.]
MRKTNRKINYHYLWMLVIIALIAITLFSVYKIRTNNQKELETSYFRQNGAFIMKPINDNYTSTILDQNFSKQFEAYENIESKSMLYAYLQLFEKETGVVLSFDEIKDYLSQEFNTDGSRRASKDYPKIQAYIDFIWGEHEKEKVKVIEIEGPSLLTLYRRSLIEAMEELREPYRYMSLMTVPLDQMEKMVAWAFDVSEEQKAKGYKFNSLY